MLKKTLCIITALAMSSATLAESLDSALQNAGSGKTVPDPSKYNIQKPDELTGDTKLSCEAILCLSTSDRPSECNPAIRRYFSIKKRKFSDTIRARRDFLNKCPASQEPNMPELVNALANGAGRCDAAELNRINRYTVEERVCSKGTLFHTRGENNCKIIKVTRIRNHKPGYCTAYFDHGWTQIGTRYVGDEKNGGKWVD